MPRLRFFLGLTALLAAAIGVNILIMTRDLFALPVVIPVAIALVLGGIWIALAALGQRRDARGEAVSFAGFNAVVSSLIVLGICITLYAFAVRWNAAWDLTKQGRTQFAPQTVQVLQGLDEDVHVLCFFPGLEDHRVEIARDRVKRFMRRCTALSWRLKVEYLDMEADVLRIQQLGISNIPKNAAGVVVIKAGSRKRMIALTGVNPSLKERDFTNALINVVRNATTKVYVLKGHGEDSMDSSAPEKRLAVFQKYLSAEGYQTAPLTLNLMNPQVPSDCDILVIAGPEQDLQQAEVNALEAYKKRGGRMLVLMDPPFQRLPTLGRPENFRPWLERAWGIKVGNDMVISLETQGGDLLITPSLDGFPDNDKNSNFMGSYNYKHPITRGASYQLLFKHGCSVSLDRKLPQGVAADPILRTRKNTYAETNLRLIVNQHQTTPDKADKMGPITVAVAATAKTKAPVGDTGHTRDARIVVAGDSTFATDHELPNNAGDRDLLLNMLGWLSEQEELIAVRATGDEQQPVILSDTQRQVLTWLSTLGTVQLVLLAGISVYFVRRKYQ